MLMVKENNRKSVLNELMKHKELIGNKKIKEKVGELLKERNEKNKVKEEKKTKLQMLIEDEEENQEMDLEDD